MRVLAGRYKSKLIRTINDPLTRPMMSKVRESIFNSLQFNIENKDILDLYAGSGSLGIESLSRGANFVTFIENSDDCTTILKKNLNEFENTDNFYIFHAATKIQDNKVLANGGRVLSIVSLKNSYADCRKEIFDIAEKIDWEFKYYRKDIGANY